MKERKEARGKGALKAQFNHEERRNVSKRDALGRFGPPEKRRGLRFDDVSPLGRASLTVRKEGGPRKTEDERRALVKGA